MKKQPQLNKSEQPQVKPSMINPNPKQNLNLNPNPNVPQKEERITISGFDLTNPQEENSIPPAQQEPPKRSKLHELFDNDDKEKKKKTKDKPDKSSAVNPKNPTTNNNTKITKNEKTKDSNISPISKDKINNVASQLESLQIQTTISQPSTSSQSNLKNFQVQIKEDTIEMFNMNANANNQENNQILNIGYSKPQLQNSNLNFSKNMGAKKNFNKGGCGSLNNQNSFPQQKTNKFDNFQNPYVGYNNFQGNSSIPKYGGGMNMNINMNVNMSMPNQFPMPMMQQYYPTMQLTNQELYQLQIMQQLQQANYQYANMNMPAKGQINSMMYKGIQENNYKQK